MTGTASAFLRNNVLGLVAIYLALGGIALGTHPGGANTVSSGDVIDNELTTLDLKNNQIRTADVRDDSLAGGGLTSADVAADTLTNDDIAASAQFDGAVAAGDLAGTYPNPTIADGAVSGGTGGEVTDDSITNDDIAAGAQFDGAGAAGDLTGNYPNPTIATGAVGSADVNDNSLTGVDIDETTLSGVPLTGAAGGDLTGTYPNPTIASGAIGSGEVADNSLVQADLGTSSVGADEVAANSLTGADVADTSSLTGAEILESTLTLGGDLFGNVANASIGVGKVDSAAIADNTITGSDVNESTIGKVPSALTADAATNAINANDASTLDGTDSTLLVVGRSSGADTGECVGALPEAFETCADVTVNFPHSGRALILATAGWEVSHFEGATVPGQVDPPAYSTGQLQVDESTTLVDQTVGDQGADAHFGENNQESVAIQALTGVLPAGPHPFEFNCRDHVTGENPPSDTDIDDAYISAIVIGSG